MNLSRLAAASTLLLCSALAAFGPAPSPAVRLGEFDDRPVVDAAGAKLAEVYDAVIDTDEGRAAYLVFSVGLKVVPIALPSPSMTLAPDKTVLSYTRAQLEAMPPLDMAGLGPRYKRGRDLVGTPLKDPKGAVLGEIKDFMIDFSNGSVAAVVVAFDPKVREEKGWVAIPRQSLRFESGGYVATFDLDDMRPAAQAQAERRRFEAARAAAANLDRDERFSELKGRSLTDAQGKVLGQIADIVTDAAGAKALYAQVSLAGGGASAIALPLQGARRSADGIVVPQGAAALAPPPGSAGGRRLSELVGRSLVDGRGKEVGRVRDVILNLMTGKVHYAVAEFEPSWVAAGHLVTIKVPGEERRIELNALMGAMMFAPGHWPDINHPQFITNIDAYLAKQ